MAKNFTVEGYEPAKKAKTLLNIYTILLLIGTFFYAYVSSKTVEYSEGLYGYKHTIENINSELFILYSLIGIGTAVIIYTISNLLIQLYANTVLTRFNSDKQLAILKEMQESK